MLRCHRTIEVWIFLRCYEFRHLTSRNMLNNYCQGWISHGDSLCECSEFSFCPMDESFCDMSESISCDCCFRMEGEDYSTLDHRRKYFSHIFIVWIDISSRPSTVCRDSTWIIFHCSYFTSACIDHLRGGLRLERDSHDGCRATR